PSSPPPSGPSALAPRKSLRTPTPAPALPGCSGWQAHLLGSARVAGRAPTNSLSRRYLPRGGLRSVHRWELRSLAGEVHDVAAGTVAVADDGLGEEGQRGGDELVESGCFLAQLGDGG